MSDWRKLNPLFRLVRGIRDAWLIQAQERAIRKLIWQAKRAAMLSQTVTLHDDGQHWIARPGINIDAGADE